MFDKKIENSLLQQTNIEEYNPQILTNSNRKTIKNKVIDNLVKCNRFDIAVSYCVWSGLSLINNYMSRFDLKSRFLVTTDGYVTDPTSLKYLLSAKYQVRVYNPQSSDKGFHLKSYYFEHEEKSTLLIGSSNISLRAFGEVHEMAVEIDSMSEGKIVNEYERNFEELWNHNRTEVLTEKLIEKYEKQFYLRKKIEKQNLSKLHTVVGVEPNYMQHNALEKIKESRINNDKGLVIAATGSGKTYLSAFDVKNFKAKNVLFLVHNRIILSSAIETFRNVFKDSKTYLELFTHNENELELNDFIFTTDKTCKNLLVDKISKNYFDYIIYDEAHKIGLSNIYSEIMDYFIPKYSLGMTATPERTDNSEVLFSKFEYCIPYEIRLIDALSNKLICPFTYYGFDVEEEQSFKDNDYIEVAAYILDKIRITGHYGNKLRCIVFCNSTKEARGLSESLNDLKVYSKSITSQDPWTNEDVKEYIKRLQNDNNDDIKILCVVDKFNEGVDIPEINTIVMLRSTMSSIVFLQQLGRGLRLTSDEHKFVTVIDMIGNYKNNYSITMALSGRETTDKEKLVRKLTTNFETVSPFINVQIEEIALRKLLRNLSVGYSAETQIKNKFIDEFNKFEFIPDLKDMYLNPFLNEFELLHQLTKSLLNPFETHYKKKYKLKSISKKSKDIFNVINQFVFRILVNEQREEYVRILNGEKVICDIELVKMYAPKQIEGGKITPMISEYYKKNSDSIFIYENNHLSINKRVINYLDSEGLLSHLSEVIELFKVVKASNGIKPFQLYTKVEILKHFNCSNLSPMVGEIIQYSNKMIYLPVSNLSKKGKYPNYIIDEYKVQYFSQNTKNVKKSEEKQKMFLSGEYKIVLLMNFPKAKYNGTSYFYMGDCQCVNVGEITKHDENKYNFGVELHLQKKIPKYLLQYKEVTDLEN